MATNTAVRQAIEKVDAACPCIGRHAGDNTGMCNLNACYCYSLKIDRKKMAFGWPGPQEKRPKCLWPGHRLVREVAKVAFMQSFVAGVAWWEFQREGATLWQSDRKLTEDEAEKRIAALPLEAVDE